MLIQKKKKDKYKSGEKYLHDWNFFINLQKKLLKYIFFLPRKHDLQKM